MGLQADAIALAELTGRCVKECKKALKATGSALRNMSIEEKAQALSWSEGQATSGERKTVVVEPDPADAPKEDALPAEVIPPVEKDIDPEPEPQVQDPEPESGVVEVSIPEGTTIIVDEVSGTIVTHDADSMGVDVVDEG